jgi:tripartite-type tricarboxylate transporter receptor subunit TctC
MKIDRRRFMPMAAALVLSRETSRTASAETFPSGVTRIIVGYPAGGSTDLHARLIAQWLSPRLGQQFVVENRPGAGGNVGTEAVVRAPPDGRTLLLCGPSNAINASLYRRLNFNFLRDVVPVAGLVRGPFVMVVNAANPATSLSDFVVRAKAGTKLNMGSAGIGTPGHLMGELFSMTTGITFNHIPYRGEAPAFTDLIGGQVDLMFVAGNVSKDLILSGAVKALGVTTAARSRALPNVPAINETISGYEAGGWAGICAPTGTPVGVIERLNTEINAGLASDGIRSRYAELGNTIMQGSVTDFAKFLFDETEKWATVVRVAGAKAD